MKRKSSNGDYRFRKDAKTFKGKFYHINYLDTKGWSDSEYSEVIDQRNHTWNRTRWIAENS